MVVRSLNISLLTFSYLAKLLIYVFVSSHLSESDANLGRPFDIYQKTEAGLIIFVSVQMVVFRNEGHHELR